MPSMLYARFCENEAGIHDHTQLAMGLDLTLPPVHWHIFTHHHPLALERNWT